MILASCAARAAGEPICTGLWLRNRPIELRTNSTACNFKKSRILQGPLSLIRSTQLLQPLKRIVTLLSHKVPHVTVPQLMTNEELISHLGKTCALKHAKNVLEVFRVIDRACFVPFYLKDQAYLDSPLPLCEGATISAPHIHALALDCLWSRLKPGARVLDVGSGSGFLSACFAYLVQPGGKVIGIDVVEELVRISRNNVRKACPELIENDALHIAHGNGIMDTQEIGNVNFPLDKQSNETVKFDVIYIGAAAPHIPKAFFLKHLNPNGCALIPVDISQQAQQLLFIERPTESRSITVKEIARVRFVPLAL